MKPLKICISPLDWGLGHTTRCIPIIRALQKMGHHVYIASEKQQQVILKEAIASAHFLTLRGYRIRYSQKGALFFLVLFLQLPQIIFSLLYEYFWLQRQTKKYSFDLIISDNRLGFYHKKVSSVFITHQLLIQTPFNWSTRLVQVLQYWLLRHFKACWIPDIEGSESLAGNLSNPKIKPTIPLWYMGCLSRLSQELNKEKETGLFEQVVAKKTALTFLGIISGPEPQRTLLEHILWEDGKKLGLPFVLVAGLPLQKDYQKNCANGKLYHHLPANELVQEIKNATYIICRGGYTSLMELISFNKKLILLPTPGQTEQVFLGARWMEKNWAICLDQSDFNLEDALKKAGQFNFCSPTFYEMQEADLALNVNKLSLS